MTRSKDPLYYADYLQLGKLLDCQKLESAREGEPVHDELLFIIVHQAYELWFKQVLWELDAVLDIFSADTVPEKDMGRAVSHLRRVVEIQRLLIEQVSVMETMTPLDFLDFRDHLVPASGLQSMQFRLIENKLGVAPEARLKINEASYTTRLQGADRERIEASEKEPSLFRLVERWLERTPFLEFGDFDFWRVYGDAVAAMLDRQRERVKADTRITDDERATLLQRLERTAENFQELFGAEEEVPESAGPRLSRKAQLAALLINLYRDEPILHIPFRLLTLLMDVDEGFTNWRYRHALMVMRMIGTKMGTGGTSGTDYLRKTADKHKVFTDLFQLSTFFIPRSALPELPPEVRETMSFQFSGR